MCSHSVIFLFTLVIVYFAAQNISSSCSPVSILVIISCVVGILCLTLWGSVTLFQNSCFYVFKNADIFPPTTHSKVSTNLFSFTEDLSVYLPIHPSTHPSIICMWASVSMWQVCGGQERAWNQSCRQSLVISHHVRVENRAWVLCKSRKCS